MAKMATAKEKMAEAYRKQREVERELDALAKEAFPVGSTHICTNYGTVEVKIVSVHSGGERGNRVHQMRF